MDEAAFKFINMTLKGPSMDWLMVAITTPENWWIPITIFAMALVAADHRRGGMAVLIALAVVGIGDSFSHNVLKPFFARPRPCNTLADINLLVGCTKSFSFPSNHAVNSFAVAGAIGGMFRPALFALVPIAMLVALSRIAVGVHYPLDVIVGGAIGFALGFAASEIARRWLEPVELGIDEQEQGSIS